MIGGLPGADVSGMLMDDGESVDDHRLPGLAVN